MKIEQDNWEPLTECLPSENFICQYGGPFAQKLELNRRVIDKFLVLAGLDGPFVLKDSLLRQGRSLPDINHDGSVTSKGSLRWGDKLRLPTRQPNILFQVESEKTGGYTAAINGGLILERLMEKTNLGVRELADPFAKQYNRYLSVGLKEALLKDKLTFSGDPFFTGRLHFTYLVYDKIFNLIQQENFDWSINGILMFHLSTLVAYNVILPLNFDDICHTIKQGKEVNPGVGLILNVVLKYWIGRRRTAKNIYQGILLPPFEIDRLIGAYGYLDYQKLRGNPLVRLAD